MEPDPIEVALLRDGRDAAVDAVLVRACERGAVRLTGKDSLVPGDTPPADPFEQATVAAVLAEPLPWKRVRSAVLSACDAELRRREYTLECSGHLRRGIARAFGRRTALGNRVVERYRAQFPRDQAAAIDPAIALALFGSVALTGTEYRAVRPPADGGDGGGGFDVAFSDGGGSGHGGHGHGCGGHGCGGGSCGGGGCGGGGCGGA